jgi:hypothetical protein
VERAEERAQPGAAPTIKEPRELPREELLVEAAWKRKVEELAEMPTA